MGESIDPREDSPELHHRSHQYRGGRRGGASKRDGEEIASTVGRKLERCGVRETKLKKNVLERKCVQLLRDTVR